MYEKVLELNEVFPGRVQLLDNLLIVYSVQTSP